MFRLKINVRLVILHKLTNITPTVKEMEAKQETDMVLKPKFGIPSRNDQSGKKNKKTSFLFSSLFVGGEEKREKYVSTCSSLKVCVCILLLLYTTTQYPFMCFSPFLWWMEGGWWAGLGFVSPLTHSRRRSPPQGPDSECCQSTRPPSWVASPLPRPL